MVLDIPCPLSWPDLIAVSTRPRVPRLYSYWYDFWDHTSKRPKQDRARIKEAGRKEGCVIARSRINQQKQDQPSIVESNPQCLLGTPKAWSVDSLMTPQNSWYSSCTTFLSCLNCSFLGKGDGKTSDLGVSDLWLSEQCSAGLVVGEEIFDNKRVRREGDCWWLCRHQVLRISNRIMLVTA
jgi:hypothetical protein